MLKFHLSLSLSLSVNHADGNHEADDNEPAETQSDINYLHEITIINSQTFLRWSYFISCIAF